MYFVVLFFKFSIFFSTVLSENTYECGEHGRFEYCIDEIPGCVIGCHCHPGYYFDTDTKICEPNSKLIEHHRRHYTGEPTRILNSATPNVATETESLLSSKLNDNVDEISNDANDIGDWLYNQFFKTIENQVINSTNGKDLPTRRSGTSIKKPERKKKLSKNRKRNKKIDKKRFRKKLLRITENDSLFDMASRSSSGSSESSSSDSSPEHSRHEKDDEHGHKKIIVYNKKPKPPLPSFIFLPNLDTPFYPPIGLPPPPVVPMYPIVPVPPVVPYDIGADCTTEATKTTLSPTTTPPPPTTTTTTTSQVTVTDEPTTQATPSPTIKYDPVIAALQLPKKRKKKISRISQQNKLENDNGLANLPPSSRQKLFSRLKERINHPSAKYFISPWQRNKKILMNSLTKDDVFDSPLIEDAIPENLLRNQKASKSINAEEPSGNVDFEYLTELIHKADMKNKTNDLPPIEYNPFDSVEMYKPTRDEKQDYSDYIVPPNTPDSRRYARPSNKKMDDLYYTKLGREIASMIRGVDVQNREANVQIEGKRDPSKGDLYFSNNSPRSYWERSVRSPLTFLNMNKNKFEYLKKSNELLFDIENKIEIIASTVPTLSLQEIENIVRVMDVAKKQIKDREADIKSLLPNTNNFNINLWPRHENAVIDNHKAPSEVKRNFDTSKDKIVDKASVIPDGSRIQMQEIKRLMAWQKPPKLEKSNIQQPNVQRFQAKTDAKPYFENTLHHKTKPQYENKSKVVPFSPNNSKEPLLGYDMNSIILKHKKYFDENHNFYINQPKSYTRAPYPSYFHQEINHFDYIN